MKGSRVQAVVQELRGEKIDIVPYDDDPARFVCNAIAPAEVSRVIIDAENHRMELIVPDDKLSLAIGKKGQNVRLASQLSGWKIDIHSESKIRELEAQAKAAMASLSAVGEDLAETLFKLGWRSVPDLADGIAEELAAVPGLGGTDAAKRIISAARQWIVDERQREQRRREEDQRRAAMTDEEKMLEVKGIDSDLFHKLDGAGWHSVEQLAHEADLGRAAEATGLGVGKLRVLQHAARIYLREIPANSPAPSESDDAEGEAAGNR
jgi:N utilization substance protein A